MSGLVIDGDCDQTDSTYLTERQINLTSKCLLDI